MPYGLTGNFVGSGVGARKDTKNEWVINYDLSPNSCTDVMCEWIVTAYRPLETEETAKDIAYKAGDTYYAAGAFRKFGTSAAQTAASKGKSNSPDSAIVLKKRVIR